MSLLNIRPWGRRTQKYDSGELMTKTTLPLDVVMVVVRKR